jgi:hypothetical protein
LLRNDWALNIWISEIPLTVCSSSVDMARSAVISVRTADCTRAPANRNVNSARGVSTSAAMVICQQRIIR